MNIDIGGKNREVRITHYPTFRLVYQNYNDEWDTGRCEPFKKGGGQLGYLNVCF